MLKRAELLRPDDMIVMWTRVFLLGQQNRCQEVIAGRAASGGCLSRSPPALVSGMGICLTRMGRAAEAIPELEQAIRIDPRQPEHRTRYRVMGYALLFLGRYDEAVVWFERSLAANPGDSAGIAAISYAAIAAAQALAGHTEEARLSAAEASRLQPTITVRSYFPFNITNPVAVAQVCPYARRHAAGRHSRPRR